MRLEIEIRSQRDVRFGSEADLSAQIFPDYRRAHQISENGTEVVKLLSQRERRDDLTASVSPAIIYAALPERMGKRVNYFGPVFAGPFHGSARTFLRPRTAFISSKGMVLTFDRPGAVTRRLAQVDTHLADP